jgi:FlaA1/EpsC-like NDP-sugar epimerase
VEIQFTGLRDGEKLNEELFYQNEEVIPTSCEKNQANKRTFERLGGTVPSIGGAPSFDDA